MMESTKLLPITIYSILSRLNVFAVFFINILFMKEPFKLMPLVYSLISFFGISLVIAPSIYGLGSDNQNGLEFHWTTPEILGLITVTCHLAANGIGRTFSSKIANDVGVVQSVFFLNLFLAFLYSFFLLYQPIEWKWSEWHNYLGVSFGTWIYQLLFVDSMRREPDATIVALIQSSVILFTMAIDYWLLNTHITPINIVGALIVAATTAASIAKK